MYKYAQTKVDGKNRLRHRVIMEEHLGRELLTEEYVHHINGDKKDNRIENLEVIDPITHGRLHHLQRNLTSICAVCGVEFTPHKTKRARNQTCSHECRYELIRRKRSKLTDEQIIEIRQRRLLGEKLSSLSEAFGISQTHISEIARCVSQCRVTQQTKEWPTIRASDGEHGGPNQRGSKGDMMLPSAVMNL